MLIAMLININNVLSIIISENREFFWENSFDIQFEDVN